MDEAVQKPIEVPIGEIQAKHISKLVTVKGQIAEVGKIQAKIEKAIFRCEVCGVNIEVLQSTSKDLLMPEICPNEACACNNGFELLIDASDIIDYRLIRLESKDNSLLVELEGALVTEPVKNSAVSITGKVNISLQGKANNMAKIGDYVLYATTVEPVVQTETKIIEPVTQTEMKAQPKRTDIAKDVPSKVKLIEILKEMRDSENSHRLLMEDVYKKTQMNDISKDEVDKLVDELGRRGDLCITGNELIVLM